MRFSALLLALMLTCLAHAQQPISPATADELPFVDMTARQRWSKYLVGKEHKAYAISETGAWSWSEGKANEEDAREAALERCERYAFPCSVYAINNTVVWDKERTVTQMTVRIRTRLKAAVLDGEYARENNTSMFVGPTKSIGTNFHSMTPPSIPGGEVLTTIKLRDLLVTELTAVIFDVLPGKERATIPGALLVPGAGLESNSNREAAFADLLSMHAPDKATPVVFFCLSYECWLSYNAALRAIKLGYQKVFWYRGGIDAWKAAKLPLVRTKSIAEL